MVIGSSLDGLTKLLNRCKPADISATVSLYDFRLGVGGHSLLVESGV